MTASRSAKFALAGLAVRAAIGGAGSSARAGFAIPKIVVVTSTAIAGCRVNCATSRAGRRSNTIRVAYPQRPPLVKARRKIRRKIRAINRNGCRREPMGRTPSAQAW